MPERGGRIVALDVGARRIGVAVSDDERRVASPLSVLTRKNRDADIAALRQIIAEQKATLIVVGLPLATGDQIGESAAKAQSLGKRLAKATGLAVEYVDEWETTVQAEQAMLAGDLSRNKRRQKIDKVAAALILQRYLEKSGR